MLVAFFESFRYVGHLFPISFLRIFLGYYWINEAGKTYKDGLFTALVYAEEIRSQIENLNVYGWYDALFQNLILPNWVFVSNVVVLLQFLVGLSLILGFFVRGMSVIGILISLHYVYLDPLEGGYLYMTFVAIFITLLWIGAGRCLGIDYFFYKRNRGIWW